MATTHSRTDPAEGPRSLPHSPANPRKLEAESPGHGGNPRQVKASDVDVPDSRYGVGMGVRYARRGHSPSAQAPRLVLGIDEQARKERGKFLPLSRAEAPEEPMLVLEVSRERPVDEAPAA